MTKNKWEPLVVQANVLVVDDNTDNTDLLSIILAQHKIECVVINDARKVLTHLEDKKNKPCDLILLDLMMPYISGNEILQKIRETQSFLNLPIIVVTATDQDDSIVHCLKNGANDYITKPINIQITWHRIYNQLVIKKLYDTTVANLTEANSIAIASTQVEIASKIAHHFNNCLAVNSMGLQKLKRDIYEKIDDNDKKMVDKLLINEDRMEKIVKSLTLYSTKKIDKVVELDLNKFITEILEIFSATFEDKKIEVRKNISAVDIFSLANPDQLRIAIHNIIQNAVDASENQSERWLSIETRTHDDSNEIVITDSGAGLSSEIQKVLYNPYVDKQQHKAKWGMGLPVAKSIVEKLNGKVFLNQSFRNTQFIISLPTLKKSEKAA